MKHTVLAVVLRGKDDETELLVFQHTHVDAGVQIPGGTVEEGETLEAAVRRELYEESGLGCSAPRFVRTVPRPGRSSEVWHYFTCSAPEGTPDSWLHRVTGRGEDAGMVFRYYWVPLYPPPELAGGQSAALRLLSDHPAARQADD